MGIEEKLMHIQTQIKAPKNLYNSFGKYNYRNAESICEAVKPFLDREKVNLRLSDEIVSVGDRFYIKATATLCDIENNSRVCVSAMARESSEKKGMDDSQITGTASSYARKYALNGLFLLDDTKDADSDEFQNQTQKGRAEKKAVETAQKENSPEMANAGQLKNLNDAVQKYINILDNAKPDDVWKFLKGKYKFDGTGELTADKTDLIINHVTEWYEAQKKKKGADK